MPEKNQEALGIRLAREIVKFPNDIDNFIEEARQVLTQMPIESRSFDFPGLDKLGYRWIPRDEKSRKARNLYFEEFIPELIENGFYPNIQALTRKGFRWVI